MRVVLAALAALGLTSAAPVWAETSDAPPAAGPTTETPAAAADAPPVNPRRMKCINVTPTGSNIPQRICKTEAQWAELRRRAVEQQQQLQNQRASCSQGGGGNAC